jgi:hypothetical protein
MTEGNTALLQDWDLNAGIGGIFDAERPIIERIRSQIPAFKTVDSSSLIAASTSFTGLLPAAFVEPGDGSTDSLEGYGEIQGRQTWAVLVVVPHYKKEAGDTSAARLAGPLALAVIRALQGWSPGDGFEPMLFTGHMDPVSSVGWALFELRFTLGVSLTTS